MKMSKSIREKTTAATATMASPTTGARPTGAAAAQSYGPRQVGDGVLFTASFPQANTVQIAGDFNDWRPERTPMRKAGDGSWQARVQLAKGVYRYRFVVDGNWQHDAHNNMTEPNPYGQLNSLVKVT